MQADPTAPSIESELSDAPAATVQCAPKFWEPIHMYTPSLTSAIDQLKRFREHIQPQGQQAEMDSVASLNDLELAADLIYLDVPDNLCETNIVTAIAQKEENFGDLDRVPNLNALPCPKRSETAIPAEPNPPPILPPKPTSKSRRTVKIRFSQKCQHPGCEFTCRFPSALKRHQVSHETEKKAKCPYEGCKAAFKRAYHLPYHIRTAHPQYMKKVGTQCRQCGRWYLNHESLHHHQKLSKTCTTKGVPKRHSCTACGSSYMFASSLKQHLTACPNMPR